MTTEVESKRFLCQDFLQAICSALALGNVDLDLCCVDTLSDLDKLFREVQLREVLEGVLRLLDDKG